VFLEAVNAAVLYSLICYVVGLFIRTDANRHRSLSYSVMMFCYKFFGPALLFSLLHLISVMAYYLLWRALVGLQNTLLRRCFSLRGLYICFFNE
jgi:hypothetical protein